MNSLPVIAIVLFAAISTLAHAQKEPAVMDPLTSCVDKLASPELIARLPYFEAAAFRLRVCRCALHPPNRISDDTRRGASPQQMATADAGTVLFCTGGILMKLGPEPAAAQPLSAALASAVDDKGATLAFVEPTIQFGGRGCNRPEYPEASRQSDAEGESTISFLVNSVGKATDVVIVKSAGTTAAHKLLDFSVALTGLQCRFNPGTLGGERIASWATVQFVWKLK